MSHSSRTRRHPHAIIQIATLTAAALFVPHAQAANVTWDSGGGASTAWSTVANWSTNALPATTDDLYFGTGITASSVISLGTARTASSLTFNTNTSFAIGSAGSPNFTITSGFISTSSTAGEQDVLTPLYTPSASGWAITVTNANDTLGLGDLYQTGSGSRNIILYGAGKITMPSDSNMTGGIAIYGPTVTFPNATTLPDVTVNSGTAIIAGNNSESFSISGTGNGSGALQVSSNVGQINKLTLMGNSTIGGAGYLDVDGALSDGGNGYTLTVTASNLILDGNSSNFTGTIKISNAATLYIGSSGAAGSSTSGAITVATGGTLLLGYYVSLNKSISLAAGSQIGSQFPEVALRGTITIAGNTTFGLAGSYPLLDVYSTISDTSSAHGGITVPANNAISLYANNTFHNGVTLGDSASAYLEASNASGPGPIVGLSTSAVYLDNSATIASTITAGSINASTGNDSIAAVKLFSNSTIDAADAGTSLTITGSITDAQANGGFLKKSPGRLILTSAGTFDGGASIEDGAVAITNGAALGTGPVNLSHNGAFNGVLEIAASITGANTISLLGNETSPTISTPLIHATSGNSTWTGSIDFDGYNQIAVDAGASLTLAGALTDTAGALVKTGAGTLTLSGAASYNGLYAQSGPVVIAASAAAPSSVPFNVATNGTIALASGVSSAAPINIAGSGYAGSGELRALAGSSIQSGPIHLLGDASIGADTGTILAINSVIDDANLGYALTKVGNGTLSLNNTNTYSGGTNIAGGTLRITADAQLGLSSSPVSITNAATLKFSSSFPTSRTINANNGSLLADSGVVVSLAGAYVNGGTLHGPGSFSLSASTTLNGASSFQGAALTQTGPASLINFTNGGTLTNSSPLTWDGGSNSATATLNVNSTLSADYFANYGILNIASGATLTNYGPSPLVLAAGSRTTVASGGTISLTNSQPLNLSSLLTNNGTITGAPINVYYGGLATGTGSWPAVNLSAGATFSPGGVQTPFTPNFATTAYIQPTPGNESVAAPVTLLADTIADVTNSTDSLTLTSQLTASGITLTKIHPGTLALTNLRAAALVATDGTLAILPSHTPSATSSLNSLTITGTGHFDLADNNLVLDYTASSPLTQIRQYLQTGALTSSSATNNSNHTTALGYAEASQLSPTTAAQIAGTLPYDSTTLLIKYTYIGDANLDGKITADDYALLDKGFAQHLTTWTYGDFNYDGVINQNDYLLIDRVFAQQTGTLSPQFLSQRESQFGGAYVQQLLTSIPEPSLLAACSLALPLFVPRRRKLA
jgi:autotransporter-associated beta strand protein